MPASNQDNNYNYGIFGLNEARSLIITSTPTAVGVTSTTNVNSIVFVDVGNFSQDSTHGWFGGGKGPLSIVDRIDFSNDSSTASVRGPLSSARYSLAATGNSNYGWFGGGSPGPLATVDRIDFSNDSATASVRGPLSLVRNLLAATGNSNYGWFGGGIPTTATVDRIDFSNDSATASVKGSLSLARSSLSATGNSNYGWFGGGIPTTATVDRIDFSNDSAIASVRGPLSLAKYAVTATGNSNYGWFGGGTNPGSAYLSIVDRIDFSNDSATASVRGPLSSGRYRPSATGNSNYGWFGGGVTPFTTATVDRIDFSNDSATASVRGPLSAARGYLSATSGQAKSSSICKPKGGNFGWFGGGTPTVLSTVDRIDFSNDSVQASIRGPLSLERYQLAATGNSNYGWFGGGKNGIPFSSQVSSIDRIDFSNDSATASVRGPLSATTYRLTATGNSNYGWFGNGDTNIYNADRVNFSNDLVTTISKSLIFSFSAKYSSAATGNSNYGWFGGGDTVSIVSRIDFSNDSATTSVRGPLSLARHSLAATGNSNYGWFGGGYYFFSPVPRRKSLVDRIDFSNDSVQASIRGPLSLERSQLAATGNSNYGWFANGNTGGPTAPVDRIDFSNDSSTASVRGPLFTSRYGLAATSNTPVG